NSKRGVPNMTRYECPTCGSEKINELSLCVVLHRVMEWSIRGEPRDYGEPTVDWESDMHRRPVQSFQRAKIDFRVRLLGRAVRVTPTSKTTFRLEAPPAENYYSTGRGAWPPSTISSAPVM